MKSKKITHSKVKNTGILFELLVRQITADTMNEVSNSPALSMMKRYFGPSTELGKELQLYKAYFDIGKLNENRAIHFIDIINNQRKKLNEKKLASEKYELVKEIKEHYSDDRFFSVKIPSYKVYASVYKTFMAEVSDHAVDNIRDVAVSKFTLVEHLVKGVPSKKKRSEQTIIETFKNQSEDVRLLAQRIMMEKFNEKYDFLTTEQKSLLREWILSTPNSNRLQESFASRIDLLAERIDSLAEGEEKVLKIKLSEVSSQLREMKNLKSIKENHLTAMMIAYQIADTLDT